MNQPNQVKFVSHNPETEAFFPTLRGRVNKYFETAGISKNADSGMYLKTIFMLGIYFVPLALIYTNSLPVWGMFLAYCLMGIGMVGIGMSIMHDAIHNAYAPDKKTNTWLGYTLNMVGGSDFTWFVQHNHLHHTYTNVYGLDEDVHDKPILRLAPTGKWAWVHKYQHLYAVLLYGMATLSWVVNKDFKQIFRYNASGLTESLGHSPRWEFSKILLNKVIYWTVTFILPLALLDYGWGWMLLGFFCMHFIAGFIMTLVFQLAHVVEETSYPLPTEQNELENSWAVHQLLTTADFSPHNKFISWWVGGLNFQIEHHLFPNICHVHYPAIAPIVRQTAEEFGLPYHQFASIGEAIQSHFGRLKALGAAAAQAPVDLPAI